MPDIAVDVPARMRSLPRDSRGYVVPYFVGWPNGQPDFRTADARKKTSCIRDRKCWLCGQGLQRRMTFVLGPMCGLNRTSAEPPCHHECSTYAVQACPFLTTPRAHRIEHNLPTNDEGAGIMLKRNPGVTLLWVTQSYQLFEAGNGVLIRIGDPLAVEFWSEGRHATLEETVESIETGIPSLMELARLDGERAVSALEEARVSYLQWIRSFFPEVEQVCRVCKCTNFDCSQCIEKTGRACRWVESDLCSACAGQEGLSEL
jgi:hypothetical protein